MVMLLKLVAAGGSEVVFNLRRIFQQYFSKSMNFAYFPLREFTEALGVTAKVKPRLEPFLEEVENYNMEWLFQILIELYTYTVSPDCQLTFKFNALVALKILLDTCEFPVLLLVEVYFLPHVRRVATYQLHATQKHRGLDYFISMGYPRCPDTKKLGYNYVRLASQIVTMMAVIKPYRLYRDQELAQASEFANALEIMRAQQWREYDIFAFYTKEEGQMRQTFLLKLKNFTRCSQRYYDYLDTYLDKLIRKEYIPKVLDPRKLLEAAEVFGCNHVLDELKELLAENRASIKTNVLRLFTDFVRWGYIKAAYMIECEAIFNDLLKLAQSAGKSNDRGRLAFRSIGGSEEQRKTLYGELVRSLQIWAVCIPKNPMDLAVQSKCSQLYKDFLVEKVEVPFSGNIKKIRNECQANLQKNQLVNLLTMKQLKKNDFDASKMRRTSSNLQELMNMDKNMTSSMATLIMQAKFITDLSDVRRFDDANSNSSFATTPPHIPSTTTHPTLTFHQKSPSNSESINNFEVNNLIGKENRQARNKQMFNKHKTVSLSNLASNEICIPHNVEQIRLLHERDSFDQNYSEDCDQNMQINQLRVMHSKDVSQYLKKSKEIIKNFQPDTVKMPVKQEAQLIQFFEETVRSPSASSLTASSNHDSTSNFVIQVTQPSPIKEQQKAIGSIITPLKKKLYCKQKASNIQTYGKLGFPTRRSQLTVTPQKIAKFSQIEGSSKVRLSCDQYLPDEEDKQCMSFDVKTLPIQDCANIDHPKYMPFLLDFSHIEGRKLLRNKDVLLKTSKIEVGFIFQLKSPHTAFLSIYLTPEENIKKLKWEVSCPSAVSCQDHSDTITEIPKQKQKKLLFKFCIQPPYSLPRFHLQYEIQGKEYRHSLIMPISFNKFIKFSSTQYPEQLPIMLRTTNEKLNSKDFPITHLASLFQDFSVRPWEEDAVEFYGWGEYENEHFRLAVVIREGKWVQVCCSVGREGLIDQRAAFLMAALLSILKK